MSKSILIVVAGGMLLIGAVSMITPIPGGSLLIAPVYAAIIKETRSSFVARCGRVF
jgi:hypothetical protein